MQGFFNVDKLINVIDYISKLKNTNHTIILIGEESALMNFFQFYQHPFRIKTLQKVGMDGTYLKIKRPYMTNPQITSYPIMKT